MSSLFLILFIVAHANGTVEHWTQHVSACPPPQYLQQWTKNYNTGMHGNSQKASAFCLQVEHLVPEREA